MTSWKRCVFGFGLGLGALAPAFYYAAAFIPKLISGPQTLLHEVMYFFGIQMGFFYFSFRIAYSPILKPFMPQEHTVLNVCIFSLANVVVFALLGWLAWLVRESLLGQIGLWAGASIILIYVPEAMFIVSFFWWGHLYAWITLSMVFLVILRPWRLPYPDDEVGK